MLRQQRPVNTVDQLSRAIAAAHRPYRLGVRIIVCRMQPGQALLTAARQVALGALQRLIVAHFDAQRLQTAYAGIHGVLGGKRRRGNQADGERHDVRYPKYVRMSCVRHVSRGARMTCGGKARILAETLWP